MVRDLRPLNRVSGSTIVFCTEGRGLLSLLSTRGQVLFLDVYCTTTQDRGGLGTALDSRLTFPR